MTSYTRYCINCFRWLEERCFTPAFSVYISETYCKLCVQKMEITKKEAQAEWDKEFEEMQK